MSYYLTFDIGTTSLKTALVSDEGAVRAVHTEEYHLHTPQPGWAEMEPEAYWRAAVAGARACLARAEGSTGETPVPPGGVAAIGFASQGQSFIPLSASGEALYNAIVWVDGRANEIARRWEETWLSREEYRRISGYPSIPGEMTIFKLAWLAEHAPAAHGAWKFLFLPDYLIWRLTGEAATDFNLAQMSGMYDVRGREWEPRLLAAAGVTAGQLPAVLAPGRVRLEACAPRRRGSWGCERGRRCAWGATTSSRGRWGPGMSSRGW
jgi:xylulokinase